LIRILALSDTHTHEHLAKLVDHDVLIHTGDFCKIALSKP